MPKEAIVKIVFFLLREKLIKANLVPDKERLNFFVL